MGECGRSDIYSPVADLGVGEIVGGDVSGQEGVGKVQAVSENDSDGFGLKIGDDF